LACSSFPLTKTVCSPAATSEGSASTNSFIVFSAFTTFTPGERTLDLLPERVRVRDEQERRDALGEVQGIGDVDQHLAVEIRLTGRA
jgi:hypothetical protein